jgi:hypothetical protein
MVQHPHSALARQDLEEMAEEHSQQFGVVSVATRACRLLVVDCFYRRRVMEFLFAQR